MLYFVPVDFFILVKRFTPFVNGYGNMYSLKTGKGAPRLISHMRDVHNCDPEPVRLAGLQRVYIPSDGSDRQTHFAMRI